jgi:hypothetical protein
LWVFEAPTSPNHKSERTTDLWLHPLRQLVPKSNRRTFTTSPYVRSNLAQLSMARAPEIVLQEAAKAAQALREVIERKPNNLKLDK